MNDEQQAILDYLNQNALGYENRICWFYYIVGWNELKNK